MRYPAIYKSEDGSTYLHASKLLFSHLVNGKAYEWRNFDGGDEHEKDKNITPEFLANTYGEVKSKEHAEFIVKLCQENNIPVVYSVKVDDAKSFMVSHGCLNLLAEDAKYLSGGKRKQITIPLPPEREGVDEIPDNTDEFDAIVSSKSVGMSEPKKSVNVVMTNKTAAIKVLEALGMDASFVQSVSINGKEVFNIENADDITTVTVSKYVKKT